MSSAPSTDIARLSLDHPEGLKVSSLQDIHEPIDPRIGTDSIPDEEELDIPLRRQISTLVAPHHHHELDKDLENDSEKQFGAHEAPLYVEFEDGDKRDPFNWSKSKKWAITLHACYASLIAASCSSAYNLGFDSMTRDLNCSEFQATIGLSLYALGFGLVPLFSASFSEEFGRQPMYYVSVVIVVLAFVTIAEAQNIQTVLIARFFQGGAASTWATMVGGTIADIWKPHERGLPMSVYALLVLGAVGLGPIAAGWIEMDSRLEWRWIQWIQLINTGVYMAGMPFIMRETRGSILLTKIAKKLRKETGDHRYRARMEDERASLRTLIYISCTRPLHLLCTEMVVTSFSLWIGFAWGILYCMIESIGGVFGTLHGFNTGQVGTVFATVVIGSVLGFLTNFYQDHLYTEYFPQRGPEARLYGACIAGIIFPGSMFIYAWCSYSSITWVAQAIGITLFIWAAFVIYLAVFNYMADCYGPFASSALAGQSLCRNLAATAFPLFTQQMYHNLGYTWANTLFALLATVMIPIPFILLFRGPQIRMKSKFSRMILEMERTTKA